MALKIRRGTNGERTAGGGVVFAEGELIYVTDTDALYIGDGVTPGGILLANIGLGNLSTYLTADNTAGVSGELELNKPLNLNGQEIVGTGNININGNITATGNIDIGDNTGDTVTITAQVDSDITPTQDSAFSLGAANKRWQNVYAAGLNVDGQIDAVSISANTVADNSTVMVNVATNTFTGNLSGNVTGNVLGNVTGNITGNVTGILDGDVNGSVFADNSTVLVDGVAGVLRGDHYGSLYGSVKALNNGSTILNPGTDGTDASFAGTVVGNVTGNVSGNVTGNVIGNVTGRLDGDVTGSVFADNSTLLVDAVAGVIPGAVISGTVTANLVGNVTGNVLGTVEGNILTTSIDSADSSTITITPSALFESNVTIEDELVIGASVNFNENTIINKDSVITTNLGDITRGLNVVSAIVNFSGINGVEAAGEISSLKGFIASGITDPGFMLVQTFTGDPTDLTELNDENFYDRHCFVDNTKAEFNVPVKFVVVADDAERATLVPTPEKGMVILMEAGTTPAATNQLQFYNGTNWINV
jgi:cytoskeletal protein CcmA (bactofilin family)